MILIQVSVANMRTFFRWSFQVISVQNLIVIKMMMLLLYHFLQGRSWTNQDGELKRIASIRCFKIEARGGVSQSPQSVPVQQPVPQPTYQQPQNFPPPVDANGNTKDDLPF